MTRARRGADLGAVFLGSPAATDDSEIADITSPAANSSDFTKLLRIGPFVISGRSDSDVTRTPVAYHSLAASIKIDRQSAVWLDFENHFPSSSRQIWFILNCAMPQGNSLNTPRTCRYRLHRFAAVLAALFCPVVPVSSGVLSGREFQNLLAGGPEGTTIVFQGGTDKIFYSPTLKNKLRLSPELGPEFLKQKILQNTVVEGVFIGATIEDGKWRTISGIAGIASDVDSGHGVLTLLQTFPEDTSIKAFQKRDRLYAVVIVEDGPSGVVCRKSHWERLFALKGDPKMTTVRCEFTVGNTVTPAGSQ